MNGGTVRALLRHRPPGWWIAPLYLVMSIAMLPWIGVLLVSLPDRVVSHNYRLAWVGFDVLLVAAMARTAWLAWRRSPFVVNVASATATLLVVDAWFDVTTAPHREMLQSFTLAVLVELPAAVLSLVIAGRAQVVIARTGAVRGPHERWLLMGPLRPPAAGAVPVATTGPEAPARPAMAQTGATMSPNGSTVPPTGMGVGVGAAAGDPFVDPLVDPLVDPFVGPAGSGVPMFTRPDDDGTPSLGR